MQYNDAETTNKMVITMLIAVTVLVCCELVSESKQIFLIILVKTYGKRMKLVLQRKKVTLGFGLLPLTKTNFFEKGKVPVEKDHVQYIVE